jgi:hypothetical protein
LGLPEDHSQLAADIICFNQGLIGAKYYSAILGNLTVWKIPGPLAKTTEIFLRSMSVVALTVTIVSAPYGSHGSGHGRSRRARLSW